MVDTYTITLGIILVLIATPMFNLAIIFQKMGLRQGPEINFDKGFVGVLRAFKELVKNKWWLLGAILGVVAWFPYIMSIGLVGFMVAEPINSIGIIIVVIAANRLLGENVAWYEFLAITILAISPVLIALAGISKVAIDLYEMVFPLTIFLIITFSITIASFIYSQKKRGTNLEGFFVMLTGSFFLAIGGVFTNILAQAIVQANVQLTWYFGIEIFFGIFWFDYPHLWVFIGWWGLAICNLASFAFYQSAFQKNRIAVVFPILDSVGLSIPIIAGILVFKQTFNNYFLFFLAIVLIFIGTSTLGKFQADIKTMEAKKSSTSIKKDKTIKPI
jgi:multidrug transporter EmrE-like cation transporter